MPEADYFRELPVALRGDIVLSLAEEALSKSHLFRKLPREVGGGGLECRRSGLRFKP